jgi:hypothetical protein
MNIDAPQHRESGVRGEGGEICFARGREEKGSEAGREAIAFGAQPTRMNRGRGTRLVNSLWRHGKDEALEVGIARA